MKNKEIINDISILIAEDEDELREFLQEYLKLFFSKVYVASCGREAYISYLDKRPDIIISDIYMPNIDGLNLISRIRESDKETQIIVMSAHSEQDKLLRAVELGLVTYMVKPINSQKLKDILFKVVDKIRGSEKRIYLSNSVFWDKTTASLWDKNEQIFLKEKEIKLFKLLCSEENHIFTSQDIFNYLYENQTNKEFSEYSITSFIKRLRAKLPQNIIQNEYGLGYKIIPL